MKHKKNDFFDRMTQLPECSQEETDEIMKELNSLSVEDMEVVREEED